MKKSTVAIISSLCTLVVCLGMFCLYLIKNNRVGKENISLPKQEEKTFRYEKTASFYVSNLSERKSSIIMTSDVEAIEIDGETLQSALSETLKSENVLYKINNRHPSVNYDIKTVKTNAHGVYEVSFKSDTEELSAEICNFILEQFSVNLMKKVGTGSFTIIDYAT